MRLARINSLAGLRITRGLAVIALIIAAGALVHSCDSSTVVKKHRVLLESGSVDDVWFSQDGLVLLLEHASGLGYRIRKWDIAAGRFLAAQYFDFRRLPLVEGAERSSTEPTRPPLHSVSREGTHVAWIDNRFLRWASLQSLRAGRYERSIPLPPWSRPRGVAFFRDNSHILVVFENDLFKVFNVLADRIGHEPGSSFPGVWKLKPIGEVLTAVSEKEESGPPFCLEMSGDKLFIFSPELPGLTLTAATAKNCSEMVVGTVDGMVLPLRPGRVAEPKDNLYDLLGAPVRLLAMGSDERVFAAGDFEGIYELEMRKLKSPVIASARNVRDLETRGSDMVYLISAPIYVRLGQQWVPSGGGVFVGGIAGAVGALFVFLYTLLPAPKV